MGLTELQAKFDSALADLAGPRDWSSFRDALSLNIAAEHLSAVMQRLRAAGLNMLIDVTVVDLLEYTGATDRYRLVYQLLDTESGVRITVTTHVNDPQPEVASMTRIWASADWMEREAYDMFGVLFSGHPNAKRLLLPLEFTSFPMRKDYPVKGRGERHNFPVIVRSES